jgi:5-methylcytosine-specific restriction endonuclease McrA
MIEQARIYATKNAGKVSEQRAAHRMANRTRINAKIAEWAKANPAKRRAKERAREGRERGAEGTHTWADIEALKVAQNGLCAVPGCDRLLADGFHVDHVIPISKGGSNWPDNLQLLCPPHNQSKATKDNIIWLLEQAEKE